MDGATSENAPSRNCLIIPEKPHFGLLGVVKMDPEAPFRYLDYCYPEPWEPSSDLSDSLSRRLLNREEGPGLHRSSRPQ